MNTAKNDPMEFLKTLWGTTGMPLPGLVTPTLDTDELDKRITDLKAVEGWLKTNLGMLQMTIQGLEMQRATLAAMQAMNQSVSAENGAANPFANPALWPWNFSQQTMTTASNAPTPQATSAGTSPDAGSDATTPTKTKGKGK